MFTNSSEILCMKRKAKKMSATFAMFIQWLISFIDHDAHLGLGLPPLIYHKLPYCWREAAFQLFKRYGLTLATLVNDIVFNFICRKLNVNWNKRSWT